LELKQGTLVMHILDGDGERRIGAEHAASQISNCWKCLTIMAMSQFMHGYTKLAFEVFQKAANVVKRDTGSVPAWLTSRL
jgi:hypothetical protein